MPKSLLCCSFVCGFSLLIGVPLLGDTLVLHDGSTIETRGAWTVEGRRVVYDSTSGIRSMIRLEHVDLERSRAVTERSKRPQAEVEPPAETLRDAE